MSTLWAAISGRGAEIAPRWWLAIVGMVGLLAGFVAFASPLLTAVVLLMLIGCCQGGSHHQGTVSGYWRDYNVPRRLRDRQPKKRYPMFGVLRPPPFCPSNTGGMGTAGKVELSNGEQSCTEDFDVVSEAAAVLKSRSHAVTTHKTWLEHGDSGFLIQPQLAELQLLEGGGVRTVTTMQVNHPTLIPAGVFEFQHSTGDTVVSSLTRGFDQWVQTDFVTFLDALRVKPQSCTVMQMTLPAGAGKPQRVRRAVLGPVTHMVHTQLDAAEGHPPFCPCCLPTNSFEAFRDLIEGDAFYGLRLFALRDGDGNPGADCRVNGDDWEKGAQALRAYASTWPAAGYEFCKRYVVLQTVEHGSRATSQQA